MRKRLLAAAVAIAALGGAGVAFAQAQTNAPAAQRGPGHMMERLDTNNDGAVTRAEFDASHQARFTQLDTNRDGSISAEERRAGRPERPERPEGARGERGPGGPGGNGMRNPDANNDGAISREEFLAGPTQMFDRLDANRDGRLSAEERPQRHGWGHGRHHRGGGMRGADANRDGNVTQAEFQAHGAQMFARMDANSDGRITTADHEARRAARQQQRSN